MLGNVLFLLPTRKTKKTSIRKSPKKRIYSNYRNTKERKGIPVPRDWKRLRYYLMQIGIFK